MIQTRASKLAATRDLWGSVKQRDFSCWTFVSIPKTIAPTMSFPLGLSLDYRSQAGAWVILGAGLLYAGSRVGSESLAGHAPEYPGRRAVGHWLPIAAVAIGAAFSQHAELALGVIFATSIASLSLVMGLLIYFSALNAHPVTRRTWPFLLPATLLPLIAGFTGRLSWYHALMMLALGAAIYSVWNDPSTRFRDGPQAGDDTVPVIPAHRNSAGKLTGAILLCIAGAVIGIFGLISQTHHSPSLPLGVLAAGVLSPILTMPMLASGSGLAQRGHAPSMATTLVGIALLNVCVLLPACVLTWYVAPTITRYAQQTVGYVPADPSVPDVFDSTAFTRPSPTTVPASKAPPAKVRFFESLRANLHPMPYPLAVWRIDTVCLLVLAFSLIPIAMGRWTLGRSEAAGLIFGYAIYLAIVMAMEGRG